MVLSRYVVFVCALIAALASPAAASRRVALVIGNSAYVNATPLANPANDAADVSAKLKDLGFDVTLGLDLDKHGFDVKLREFSSALESADAAVLFYAGHGLQIAGRNYLIPIDAKLERERDVEFEAVSLDFVLKQMELDRDTKTNIVFLDACRNNPLARNLARSMGTRSASIGNGLAETFAGVGTFISYSTQPGNVALDGEGRNSPFASALIKRIKDPGKSLTSVMIDVRKDVVSATSGKQVPWDHSALTGDFYFDPAARPDDTSELQGRVHQLEDEVAARTQSANIAAQATLTQLHQRVDQMKEESRRDWEKVFELQRAQSGIADGQKLSAMYQEIGRLQIGVVRRGKDIEQLNAEIARVEKSIGVAPKAEESARAVAPAEASPPQAGAAEPVAADEAKPAVQAASPPASAEITPETTASVTPASSEASGAQEAAAAAKPTAKSKKTVPHRRAKKDDDSGWNTRPLGP